MLDDINGLVICGFVLFLLLALSMFLRSGRGAFLISGYNIMSKEKKALFNEKALCIFYGNLLLVVAFIILLVIIAAIFEITWLIQLFAAVLILFGIGSTIYAYTSDKFRK